MSEVVVSWIQFDNEIIAYAEAVGTAAGMGGTRGRAHVTSRTRSPRTAASTRSPRNEADQRIQWAP